MKKTTHLVMTLILGAVSYAQTTEDHNPEGSKIQVYNADQSDKDYSDNAYRWAIKTDLMSVVSQEFPLIVEYRIAKKLSIEASGAITYAYFSNDNFFNQLDNEDLDKSPVIDNAFRLGVKYYPSRITNALDGWFIGLQAFTKTTTRSYDDSLNMVGKEVLDTKVKEGLSLQIGSQFFTPFNGLYEVVLGIGMANVSRDYYIRSPLSVMDFDAIHEKSTAFYLQFALRIGLGI